MPASIRQQAVLEYLATHGPAAPHVLGAAVFSDSKAPNRAAQTRLAVMAKEGLVVGTGTMNDRRYGLTEKGRALVLPPEPVVRREPPPGVPTADREVTRSIAAQLDAAGIPSSENGRVLTLDARLQRALRERDAADTSIDDETKARARAVLENPAVRAVVRVLLGRAPSPDDLLRVVVEAGVAALTETPPGRG